MDIKEKIIAVAQENLVDESHFIVDVAISTSGVQKKVTVLVDGDEGITIEQCAALSRAIALHIEENELIEDAYRLEVSSPGIDYPLQSERQYRKNTGRDLKVTLIDGKEVKGKLTTVSAEGIVIEREAKKSKKIEAGEVTIPFSEINKTIVQISFKK